jgi:hypothetical protein
MDRNNTAPRVYGGTPLGQARLGCLLQRREGWGKNRA